jgi:hypothetical protein
VTTCGIADVHNAHSQCILLLPHLRRRTKWWGIGVVWSRSPRVAFTPSSSTMCPSKPSMAHPATLLPLVAPPKRYNRRLFRNLPDAVSSHLPCTVRPHSERGESHGRRGEQQAHALSTKTVNTPYNQPRSFLSYYNTRPTHTIIFPYFIQRSVRLPLPPYYDELRNLSIVPRLIENMVPMSPHTLSLEELREPKAGGDLRFRDDVLAVFWLADDEFANLLLCVSNHFQ